MYVFFPKTTIPIGGNFKVKSHFQFTSWDFVLYALKNCANGFWGPIGREYKNLICELAFNPNSKTAEK
ncbi:hypothetical protein P872_21160 [Rhodonellum psychrophilum GCM71 = DSM 17998]|uniref:Uncharacterized protein n=1 Tax=Rhodonellum psychrophilum GCM71 = DSM 17998 TaxID=1123057 RepID=U5BS82_9BACT|nr:hypothetical protein P872_21160 [Rhodonellum psychrophilum GCM71 = DSM 17998]